MRRKALAVAALAAGSGLLPLGSGLSVSGGFTHAQPAEAKALPEFPERAVWVNSDPLTVDSLLGNVLVVEVWTFG